MQSKWGEEEWQTKEGSGNAKKEDGTQKRYLPKKAWEQMDEKEKKETDTKKQEESKKGKQFVGNTEKAKNTRKKVSEEQEEAKEEEGRKSTRGQKRKSTSEAKEGDEKEEEKSSGKNNKSAKGTHGSKHDSNEAPGKQASKDRLPEIGKVVTWKAMPGWVEGEVKEILRKAKTVDGKSVKASEDDPRIVLKSHGPSGKLAVHKPEAVYF